MEQAFDLASTRARHAFKFAASSIVEPCTCQVVQLMYIGVHETILRAQGALCIGSGHSYVIDLAVSGYIYLWVLTLSSVHTPR
jgi:hypothetical protein